MKAKKTQPSDSFTKFLKQKRTAIFFGIASVLTLVAIFPQFGYLKFFTALEQSFLDLRFQVRDYTNGKDQLEDDRFPIVIVGLDDNSRFPTLFEEDLEKYPEASLMLEPWPWNRAIHGHVTQKLFDAGAAIVSLDFTFPTPNPGDWEFYEMIENNLGQLVLGYDYVHAENELGQTSIQERLPYDDLLPLEDYEQLLGFVNIEKDSDGVLRRAKLQTNIYAENLGFMDDPKQKQRTEKLSERAPPSFAFATRTALLADPTIKDTIPPLFQKPIINYSGLDYFPRLSYIDIVLDDRFERQKHLLKDAIVLIGPYADSFKDQLITPYGIMNGVETHAHVVRSLLHRSFYSEIHRSVFIGIAVLCGLALFLGNLKLKAALRKAGWTLCLTFTYLLVSQFCFSSYLLVLPVVPMLWILVGTGSVFIIYDFALAQHERTKLRGYLSRYVSPEVANVLADESSDLESLLKGANRPIAVLFSDIRGFTTLSERYAPVDLVDHLNDYFESMVDSIHEHSGILNKYIGDAILAVWGGLFSTGQEQDCYNAVKSALDMERRMIELNKAWESDPNKLPLAIGIGISYGDAFVGNMGHSKRMEFAVMGDVVNLGSRLEGATKQYGCSILVSEEVYKACQRKIRFREIDIIQVKGKTTGIKTYSPVNLADEAAPNWYNQWESALNHYRSRKFAEAKKEFSMLESAFPELSKGAALYQVRCDELIADPPPEDWDYVYVMKTK